MSRRRHPTPGPAPAHALRLGRVVAAHGRHCLVEDPDNGEQMRCHPRGKRNEVVVGDLVRWAPTGDEGIIEAVEPRRNLLHRQDEWRTKSFAANIDLVLVLLAADPEFSESQLARALIAAEAAGIDVLIALNKRDVQPAFDHAWARLAPYRRMGYDVLPLCLRSAGTDAGEADLRARLKDRATLVLGPSGVGKSTLVNRLIPKAQAETGEISRALNSGRHTTTSTTWYWTDEARHTALIDSPGFQEFGLAHIGPERLVHLMPDLREHLGGCRFYNCTHRQEPGCSVRAAVQDDTHPEAPISASRYRLYGDIFEQLSRQRTY